jgi:succinate dehydrogenase flavin-adding protein (antitoxin of CptAB toxin-antitoxin module)
MTLTQMAEKLELKSASGLRWQVHRGILHADLIGKTYVVSDEEYERYKREHAGKPGRKKKGDTP